MIDLRRSAAWSALTVLAAALPASAHDGHRAHQHREHHEHQHQGYPASGAAEVVVNDALLVDQNGRRVRPGEIMAGRIAVVNFVYTHCTTICPIASATFAQLQAKLGPALGKEVALISISVDPVRDTPERLHEYAAKHQARPGWSWLTGAKADVDRVLQGFGAYTANFTDHPAMVLVGDASGKQWSRLFGFPSVDALLARVNALRHHEGH